MSDTAHRPGDFASRHQTAFAQLQIRVETACAAEPEWPGAVATAIRAALAFSAAHPDAAETLTNEALAGGRAGFFRYDRMIAHFSERLAPGREQRPENAELPEITEKMMIGGLATLIAQRLDLGRQAELPAIAAEAIQFVLTPYLGGEEARRIASVA